MPPSKVSDEAMRSGLVSRKRGRPSAKRFPEAFRRAILTLITAH
jgi:hypothetical protein